MSFTTSSQNHRHSSDRFHLALPHALSDDIIINTQVTSSAHLCCCVCSLADSKRTNVDFYEIYELSIDKVYNLDLFTEPDITLESDGDVYCQNNGGSCGEIPSKDHKITCRVKHSESNPPEMTVKVNGETISNGSEVNVTINSDRYYDGVISASYYVPENANSTCIVTDSRGTYYLTSQPSKFTLFTFV